MKNLKKVSIVSFVVMSALVLTGCGESNGNQGINSEDGNQSINSEDGNQVNVNDEFKKDVTTITEGVVTKKAIKTVQEELSNIKKEIIVIQADGSLSKNEKADKISALEMKLREKVKKSLGK